jgi:hypothetical protein
MSRQSAAANSEEVQRLIAVLREKAGAKISSRDANEFFETFFSSNLELKSLELAKSLDEELVQVLITMAAKAENQQQTFLKLLNYFGANPAKQVSFFQDKRMADILLNIAANKALNEMVLTMMTSIILDTVSRISDEAQVAALFATKKMAAVLVKIAGKTDVEGEIDVEETRDNVAKIISCIASKTSNKEKIVTLFAATEMVAVLVKMANETDHDILRSDIAIAVRDIILNSSDKERAAALFAKKEVAAVLVKMANETNQESVKANILATIGYIISNSSNKEKAVTLFAAQEIKSVAALFAKFFEAEEMAAILVKMAGEAKDGIVGSNIFLVASHLLSKGSNQEQATLFTTKKIAATLLKIASKASDKMMRDNIALIVSNIISKNLNKPLALDLFAKKEMVTFLLGVVHGTDNEEVKSEIAEAIGNIISNSPNEEEAIAFFTTTEMEMRMATFSAFFKVKGAMAVLVKIADETKDPIAMFAIVTTASDILLKSRDKAQAAALFATKEMAAVLAKRAGKTSDPMMRYYIRLVVNDIISNSADKARAAALFATEEMATALVKMASNSSNESERSDITLVVNNIISNSADKERAAALFATKEMAAALVRMAGETSEEVLGANIALVVNNIISNSADADKAAAAALFTTEEALAVLLKIAGYSTIWDSIIQIKNTVCVMIKNSPNQEAAPLFATPEMAMFLVNIANRTNNGAERAEIADAIGDIILNSADKAQAAALFAGLADPIKIRLIESLIRNTNNEVYDNEFALKVRGAIASIVPGNPEFALGYQRQIGLRRVEVKEAFAMLNSALSKYNEQKGTNAQFDSFKIVLRRFLLEDQELRGGDAIFTDANKVLEFLCANPRYLEMVEEFAQHDTAACVNQPMAAWFKIYSLVAIGRAQTVNDKVEAAKISLIFAEIIEFIKKDNSAGKPHDSYEVEAINLMIAMFCHRALGEGQDVEFWPKIQGVPYQQTINPEWLQRSFKAFYEGTGLEILQSKKYEDLLSRILTGDRGVIFFRTAFPELAGAVEAEVEKEKAELQYLSSLFDEEGKQFEDDSFDNGELVQAIEKQREGGMFEEPSTEKEKAFAEKYKGVSRRETMTLFDEARFDVKITKGNFIKELIERCMERIEQEGFSANPRPSIAQASAASSAVTNDIRQSLV